MERVIASLFLLSTSFKLRETLVERCMRGIWQHIFHVSSWPSPPRLWDAVMERGSDSLDVTAEETEKGEKGDKNNG